jgi:transcriptional regulator with XRE-family HTH domain
MTSSESSKRNKSSMSSYKQEDALALKEELLAQAPDSNLEIVEAVRRARHVSGMTQAEYAAATGVSLPTLSSVERGKGSPTLATINALLLPLGLQLGVVKSFQGKITGRPWRRPNVQDNDRAVQQRQASPKLKFDQPRKSLTSQSTGRSSRKTDSR